MTVIRAPWCNSRIANERLAAKKFRTLWPVLERLPSAQAIVLLRMFGIDGWALLFIHDALWRERQQRRCA